MLDSISYEEQIKKDVEFLVRTAKSYGVELTEDEATNFWLDYSDLYAAGWLSLPETEKDLGRILLRYFPKEKLSLKSLILRDYDAKVIYDRTGIAGDTLIALFPKDFDYDGLQTLNEYGPDGEITGNYNFMTISKYAEYLESLGVLILGDDYLYI